MRKMALYIRANRCARPGVGVDVPWLLPHGLKVVDADHSDRQIELGRSAWSDQRLGFQTVFGTRLANTNRMTL